MKHKNFLRSVITAAMLFVSIPVLAEELIPISFRPFSCTKSISRFETKDVPVAVYRLPGRPTWIEQVTIEGWIQPTKVKIFRAKRTPGQNRWCGVKAGGNETDVLVFYFEPSAILAEYDSQPHTTNRVLAVLRLDVRVKGFAESFVGYASFNIVR